MREGSIYRTRDDDGVPRALLGLECMVCGRLEPDAAHIAEALAQGAQVSDWGRLQLEIAVAGSTRSLARFPFTIPTPWMPPLKRLAVERPGVPRRVLN
jgi:hypothetical protein